MALAWEFPAGRASTLRRKTLNLFADTTLDMAAVLPLLVFVAEVCVVTLSTVRIIFVSRGLKILASVLGFFEVSIWLFAIGQIMQNLSNVSCYFAFAGGFTLGNYLGITIEKMLAIGTVVVRAITCRNAGALQAQLKAAGFGVTSIDAQGANGAVKIVFTVIKRKELSRVIGLVQSFDPNIFYAVDEIKETAAGVFPAANGWARDGFRNLSRVLFSAKGVEMPNRATAMFDGAAREAA
jgi:uncharacterized protein YebE (UPF0316 family)